MQLVEQDDRDAPGAGPCGGARGRTVTPVLTAAPPVISSPPSAGVSGPHVGAPAPGSPDLHLATAHEALDRAGGLEATVCAFLAALAAGLTILAVAAASSRFLPAHVVAALLVLVVSGMVSLARRDQRVDVVQPQPWRVGPVAGAVCALALVALSVVETSPVVVTLGWLAAGGVLGWLVTAAPAGAGSHQTRRVVLVVDGAGLPELIRSLPVHLVPVVPVFTDDGVGSTPDTAVSSRFLQMCDENRPDIVVVGSWRHGASTWKHLVEVLAARGVALQSVEEFLEDSQQRIPLDRWTSELLLPQIGHPGAGYRMLQTLLDLAAGVLFACFLVVLWPLVAAAVKMDSRGPVFYRQRRVGLGGAEFDILKFRTMTADAEAAGPRYASARDSRVTSVGRFLRRSRLDELPQAINLLRRDMSFIGPRPERPAFVAEYRRVIPGYDQRHAIRPGLTGWAQVTEGYVDDLDGTRRKVERDLYYLKRRSALLDWVILTETIRCFLVLDGR